MNGRLFLIVLTVILAIGFVIPTPHSIYAVNSITNSTEQQQNCDSTSTCTDFSRSIQTIVGGDNNDLQQAIIQKEECVQQSNCLGAALNQLLIDGSNNIVQQDTNQEDRCSESICINAHLNTARVLAKENLVSQVSDGRNGALQSQSSCSNAALNTVELSSNNNIVNQQQS